MSETARRLLDHLRTRAGEMAGLLADLVGLESPSHDPLSQRPVLARLARELEGAGFQVRTLRGRTSGGQILARSAGRPSGGPVQLLLGHCDTVWPVGTLARMPVAVRDGHLWGPGAYDMKAGLVQGIFALRALRELGLAPTVTPVFFINSDEEIQSNDSGPRIVRLARRAERVFVLEPALGREGRLKTRRKGSLRFTLRVFGRAAHSGLDPEKGASAIQELALQIQALYALADPARGITVNVGLVEGGMRPNVVAPEARAEIDVRVLARAEGDEVERRIRALTPALPGTRLEVEGGFDRLPLEATPGNRSLWEAARRCAGDLGLEIGEGTAGGASDGSLTSPYTATLDGLGAVGDGAHAEHEQVELARCPERAALLALLLLEPAGLGCGS